MPDLYRPVSLAMNLFLIRPDSEKVNPLYIYLFLKQNEKYVKSFAQGSVTLTITKDAVRNLEILLPERNIQDEVVNIYEIFASKIELNKKMNETLERIRETLFKSWFIDFDPVRAKAEGRPTGLSKEICDLFPDSFEDSESGEIPKGWKLSTLSEIFDIQGGSQPPAKTFIVKEKEGYIRLLQIRDYDSSDHVTYIPAKKNLRIVDEDEVLIGRYGSGNGKFMEDSLGRPLRGLSGAINVAIVRTIPKIENSREFIAIMASSGLFYRLIVGGSARAVQAGFKKEDLDYINFPVPSPEILLVFEEFGALVWKRIKALREENRTISELRDTLLPKLISGELKIPEAENLVKEAGI
jgi:type I restriction enzyme S subunit